MVFAIDFLLLPRLQFICCYINSTEKFIGTKSQRYPNRKFDVIFLIKSLLVENNYLPGYGHANTMELSRRLGMEAVNAVCFSYIFHDYHAGVVATTQRHSSTSSTCFIISRKLLAGQLCIFRVSLSFPWPTWSVIIKQIDFFFYRLQCFSHARMQRGNIILLSFLGPFS